MSTGRLVINGKTWGEFESAKRIKGHIVISGYESYGGCHTVRGIKQPELNENQQIVLDWLKALPLFPISAVYLLEAGKNVPKNVKNAYENFDKKEEAEVLQAFSQWMKQEEK
ncbi:hypothetical protein IDE00_002070 [Enterococcus faecalis]|uniref:hypothetical protein n=1 Tax=Enterococcus faecalis TaxID=1351 RepID=UPI001A0CE742|nr:hypothetical protein [Enterococcus faecalis]EGO2800776.1 hypothetical protein [Enterococcus faecalis]EJB2752912.1 hypothetical protein [Enterococcus faecalis]EKZ0433599.1 hypothetical protein [Enterococcus faecalis]MCU9782002.1 hypothetical protein [Enterococcus faecalis]MCU9796606.1 hypothetical protein [Enterococcus faecalis]